MLYRDRKRIEPAAPHGMMALAQGGTADRREHPALDRSRALEIGYDNATRIAKHAHHEGLTLKERRLALGSVDAETLDRVVGPETMTGR